MTDETSCAEARAVRVGALLALLGAAQAAVLVVGRPARTVAVAAAVAGVVVVLYLHLIRYNASRPIKWGPGKGLSWADHYGMIDTMARGDAITDPRLVRPALTYGEQMRKSARVGRVLGPLYVVGFGLRLVTGDLSPRRLVFDILTAVVLACFVVRGLRRMPRILQAEDRTRTLHALR